MMCNYKDLTEVVAGQGCFPIRPLLSCKNISYKNLLAILRDAPEIHTTDFIFQPMQLKFAYPYNHGKRWLREIKDVLLIYPAEKGQKLYPAFYDFVKGNLINMRGRIFVKNLFAHIFSYEDLLKIAERILEYYIILPRKLLALNVICERVGDTNVEIGRIQSPKVSGDGFFINFALQCRLSKVRRPKPFEFFLKMRAINISLYGHQTSRRKGLLLLLLHLLEYGNRIAEVPEHAEKLFEAVNVCEKRFCERRCYIARDVLESVLEKNLQSRAADECEPILGINPDIKHERFGLGKIQRRYIKEGMERIDVLFFNDMTTRTLVLKFAKDHLEFYNEKINYLEYDEETHISMGTPIYENCIFNGGVVIDGSSSPIFISCIFDKRDGSSVVITDNATCLFHNCKITNKESFPIVSINNRSYAIFRSCTIGSSYSNGIEILDGALGKFDNCKFKFGSCNLNI